MSRPEHIAPADVYYNEENAAKYARNSRNAQIQAKMTERAIELLALPSDQPQLILDLGCGSGLSSEIINEHGHAFIGVDLSADMISEALDREVDEGGDLIQGDLAQGIPGAFRVGSFDGCISISVLQWLLSADNNVGEAHQKLKRLFAGLHKCLKRGGRAVFQFYPETSEQVELVTSCALRAGFGGGLIVDFPNSTKAKKHYLVLHAGFAAGQKAQQVSMEDETVKVDQRLKKNKTTKKKTIAKKSKQWVKNKKTRQRLQGKEVRPDSKYSGRRRRGKF